MTKLRRLVGDAVFWGLCTPFCFVAWAFAWLSDIVKGELCDEHRQQAKEGGAK